MSADDVRGYSPSRSGSGCSTPLPRSRNVLLLARYSAPSALFTKRRSYPLPANGHFASKSPCSLYNSTAGVAIGRGGSCGCNRRRCRVDARQSSARLQLPVRGRLERAVISRTAARRSMSIMRIRPMRWKPRSTALRPYTQGTADRRCSAPAATATPASASRWARPRRGCRPGDRHRRQSAHRGPRRDPRQAIMAAAPGATEIGGRRDAIAAAIAEAGPERYRAARRQGP